MSDQKHVINHTASRVHVRRLRWQNSKGEAVNSREIAFDADVPDGLTAQEFAYRLDEEALRFLNGEIAVKKEKLPLTEPQKELRQGEIDLGLQKALEMKVDWIPNRKGNGWHAKLDCLTPEFSEQFTKLFDDSKKNFVKIGDYTYSLFGEEYPMMGRFGKAKT